MGQATLETTDRIRFRRGSLSYCQTPGVRAAISSTASQPRRTGPFAAAGVIFPEAPIGVRGNSPCLDCEIGPRRPATSARCSQRPVTPRLQCADWSAPASFGWRTYFGLSLLSAHQHGNPMASARERIQQDVIDQIAWDSRVPADHVNVAVAEDGSVTLSGTVPTHFARQAADDDAWMIPGVQEVRNELTVQSWGALPEDAEIQESVRNALRWTPELEVANEGVTVDGGTVTLEGSVDALWKKLRAEGLVLNIAGVLNVKNRLVVAPTHRPADQAVGEAIVTALARTTDVNPDTLDVAVENGIVTLTGSVPSIEARRHVQRAALYTGGAVDVRNQLTVSPGLPR